MSDHITDQLRMLRESDLIPDAGEGVNAQPWHEMSMEHPHDLLNRAIDHIEQLEELREVKLNDSDPTPDLVEVLSQPILKGTHEQVTVIIQPNEEQPTHVILRTYFTGNEKGAFGKMTEEQQNAFGTDFVLSGEPKDVSTKVPTELLEVATILVDGVKQIEEMKAAIQKAKTKKPAAKKTTTKSHAKPKAKTKDEKVAEQRKAQIQAAQNKAKDDLQQSLGLDRLTGEEKPAEPEMTEEDMEKLMG